MVGFSRRRFLRGVPVAVGVLGGCGRLRSIPGGHLYVENRMGGSELIALSVSEGAAGARRIIRGEFEIPASHAIQFEGVLESGNTYDIRAIQPEIQGRDRLTITVDACDEGDPAEKLDVSILVSSNGPDITVYGCDRGYRTIEEFTYADPSEYRVGTVTGTIATPSPAG